MKIFILVLSASFLLGCGGFRGVSGSAGQGQGLCSHPIHVSWTAPTQNTDGSPLTNLGGFKIYWGTASHNYTQNLVIADPTATQYTLCNFTPATYYFAMTAYNTLNIESAFTNEIQYTFSAAASPLKAIQVNLSGANSGKVTELAR